jgi:ATPase subunit of ABC transporter with duplicated ATPase domains
MFTVRNIRKTLGGRVVLDKVGFSLGKGQKVALVGANGVGKSTLMKIIAGIDTPDRGTVEMAKRSLTGYLPQELLLLNPGDTVLEFLREETGVAQIEWRMKMLEPRLEELSALTEYDELSEKLNRIAHYSFEDRARNMLDGLFLSHIDFDRRVETLSGGEKTKLHLASVLLRGADILLLDEPTNNLDLPTLLFLERFLISSQATSLIASHDRRFLDAVVTKVFELDWFSRSGTMWTGNWSQYFHLQEEKRRFEKEQYEKEQAEKIRLKESSDEKREWARIGGSMMMPDRDKMSQGYHRNRSEQKFGAAAVALETRSVKAEIRKLTPERDPFRLYFDVKDGDPKMTISLSRLVAGYPDAFRIGPIDMDIPYGARVAFLGLNGSGKSTVLRTLSGSIMPISGRIEKDDRIRIGDLMQAHENIPREKTPIEWFIDETHFEEKTEVAIFLREFQMNGEMLDAKLGRLSPGERARLSIAMAVAKGVNTLLLDEPTNHLDLTASQALEAALEKYPGTVILVSHDREFLDRVAIKRYYLFEGNTVQLIADRAAYMEALMAQAEKDVTALLRRFGKI